MPVEPLRIACELGYVDDDPLAALYRECTLLAFPSRYEGFGLPVLEAMSYGAPVVASNASSVPEAGGDAACYVPPDDAEALAAAILRVAGRFCVCRRVAPARPGARGAIHAGSERRRGRCDHRGRRSRDSSRDRHRDTRRVVC